MGSARMDIPMLSWNSHLHGRKSMVLDPDRPDLRSREKTFPSQRPLSFDVALWRSMSGRSEEDRWCPLWLSGVKVCSFQVMYVQPVLCRCGVFRYRRRLVVKKNKILTSAVIGFLYDVEKSPSHVRKACMPNFKACRRVETRSCVNRKKLYGDGGQIDGEDHPGK